MKQGLQKVMGLTLVLLFILAKPAMSPGEEALPLFQDEEILEITITAPFNTLIKASKTGKDEFPATLSLQNENTGGPFEIILSPRGNSRRTLGICTFPPLRVDLKKKQVAGTLLHGQNKLKLVTHCQNSGRYQDLYIREFLIYKALNVLTPVSFQVRMAEVTYIDSDGKRDPETKYGFFIEDLDDLAARQGLSEIKVEKIGSGDLNPEHAALVALFQYLIGNLDWSNTQGPKGEDCCHNSKLIAKDGGVAPGQVYSVPYDFDFSGLVDAPYAVPPENLSQVRNVRQRLYRGFCRHNNALEVARQLFLEKETELRAVFGNDPLLSERGKEKALSYLDDFFEILKDEKKSDRALQGKCIN